MLSITFQFENMKELRAFLDKTGGGSPRAANTSAGKEKTTTGDDNGDDGDLDANGDPWDADKHDKRKTKKPDGTWVKRRGRRTGSGNAPKEGTKSKGPSKGDCTNALKAVAEKYGKPRCVEILAEFDVSQIRGLEESQYADFISVCENAVSDDDGDGMFDD